MTIEVIGRNGIVYDAKHIKGNRYIVGKFIVTVEDGRVVDTLCKATKVNISMYSK